MLTHHKNDHLTPALLPDMSLPLHTDNRKAKPEKLLSNTTSISDPTIEHTSLPDPHTPISDPPRRSTRATVPPVWYGLSALTSHTSNHPTYSQAMASPDKVAWLTAMQEEFEALKRHSVGTLVDAPTGANVLGGMWVLTGNTMNSTGSAASRPIG